MTGRESLFDVLAARIARPRKFLRCSTCLDFGMLEEFGGQEDACPTCEGGIWRERESWRWWLGRQSWRGWHLDCRYGVVPTIWKETPA